MTAVDVDALDAARAAATADGEWRVGLRAGTGTGFYTADGFPLGSAGLSADAAYIVAMHAALPDLLAEVRRGRALREAVEGLADEYEAYVRDRGKPQPGSFDHGLNMAQTAAATDIRAALAATDGTP